MTDMTTTTTVCGYCGVGCRLEAHAVNGHVVSITPALDGPANKGHACVKGRFAHQFGRHRHRLTSPLIREGDGFREASWDEAIELVARELGRIRDGYGPDSIAGLASSRASNEDCFAMQRLMRGAIGTNNIDNCARVCHAPTSFAMRTSLGRSGATGSFNDIELTDAAVLIGSNTTEAHPVVGARIKQATLRGMKLVTIDPRRIELSQYAVLHLSPRPGTNVAVLNGLAHVLIRDGLIDRDFIAGRTEGFDELQALLDEYAPDQVERISGVPASDLERAAHIYGEAGNASIIWGLGVTEHRYGSDGVRLICNLGLLTGNVGRPGAALLPLRGQNNVQGSSDIGALPDTYSGYRAVSDEETARLFESRWNAPLSRTKGLTIPQMFDAAVGGSLKAMYIMGEDVAQTDPNTTHVVAALEALDFLVVQELFETETTRLADVVLPATTFLEKNGTFINAERRFQLVQQVTQPPEGARHDLEIITAVSRALGHDMHYDSPEDVMADIAALTPAYAGVTYPRIGRGGLQWPVAEDGTDSPIHFEHEFALPGGRAKLAALPYRPPGSAASTEFPLILMTGRRLEHHNNGSMTRRTGNLDLVGTEQLEINPRDAKRHWITDGAAVCVRSAHGEIRVRCKVTDRCEPGRVFLSFHFPEARTNLLIGGSVDINTGCPEYKVVAVDVLPVSRAASDSAAMVATV